MDVIESFVRRHACNPSPVGRKLWAPFTHKVLRHLFAPLSANSIDLGASLNRMSCPLVVVKSEQYGNNLKRQSK